MPPFGLHGKEEAFPTQSLEFRQAIRSLSFHPHEDTLAIASSRYVFIWDLHKRKIRYSLPLPPCDIRSIEFSPQGRYLFMADYNCNRSATNKGAAIQLWELIKGKAKPFVLGTHPGKTAYMRIGRQDRRLVSVSPDGIVKVWSLAERKLLYSLRIPPHSKERLALIPYSLSPSLKILTIRNWKDYYMILYTIPKRGSLPQLLHRTEYPFEKEKRLFSFAPNGSLYFDGLRLRQSRDGKLLARLKYHSKAYPQMTVFGPKAGQLAIAMEQKLDPKERNKPAYRFSIELYNSARGTFITSLEVKSRIKAMAFHPSGHILGVACERASLHFFTLP